MDKLPNFDETTYQTVYKCSTCGSEFATTNELLLHVITSHKGEKYKRPRY